MGGSDDQIVLQGIFFKASTTIDGGWRITFDLDASQAQQMILLSELKDQLLNIAITAE